MLSVFRPLAVAACWFTLLSAAHGLGEPSAQPAISHHVLSVELRPDSHELIVTDRLTVHVPEGRQTVAFSLAPTLKVERITATSPDQPSDGAHRDVPFQRTTP
ncbi:MAG TPA: hypothetical protein VHF07_08930, partial [Nitrospiraceae bacterium]|nr:hypothetical protein [Nitrospiraceae bacterium]